MRVKVTKIYILVNMLLISSTIAQPNNSNYWELTNGPFGQKITTIDILNKDSVLVCTNSAGVFLFESSTYTWKNIYSNDSLNEIYSSIVTPSNDILFSVRGTNHNYAIIKINKNLNSRIINKATDVGRFASINDSTHNFIMFITRWNGVLKSEDNGSTWNDMGVGLYSNGLTDIKYDTTLNSIILSTNAQISYKPLDKKNEIENGILFSDDFGETFYNVLVGNFDNLLINQKGLILAITDGVILYRSKNNGNNWEEINTQNYLITHDILISSDTILFAVNKEGLFSSSDFGSTWELINDNIPNLTTIRRKNDSTFYIGSINGFYEYSTVSNAYTDLSIGLYASNIWTMLVNKDNTLIAGGGNGTIYYTENAGAT